MERARIQSFLALIVVAALLLRVGIVVVDPPIASEVLVPLADATDYDHLARMILHGNGFVNLHGNPTAFRPPVYPLFLATVYFFAGEQNLVAVALVQAALGALATLLLFLLARKASVGFWGALGSAALYAFYPAFIVQVPQILSEELGRVLLLAALLLIMNYDASRRMILMVVAGVTFGLAILNKSVLAATVPFLCLALLLGGSRALKDRLRSAVIFGASLSLVVGAWTVRNALVSVSLIPVSTNFPITFAHGVTKWNVQANEWYGKEVALLQVPEDFRKWTQMRQYHDIGEEREVGAHWGTEARNWIAEHGALYTAMTLRKGFHFWSCFIRGTPLERAVAFLSMGTVIVGGWVFLLMYSRTSPWGMRRFSLLAVAIALPVTVPYAMSQCDVRYRLSLIDPLWMIFCGALLAHLIEARRNPATEG
ncbi:glycosyltransferase family 39 protein [Candidatus Sumerlaeota bacterium]|nr:glycosyltransferase family 39 protein [Candidatus Sumerlaeota bacterium]